MVSHATPRGSAQRYTALLRQANGHMGQQQFAEAEAALREALTCPQADAAPKRRLAVVLMHQSKHPQALVVLRELLQASPDDEKLLLNLGVVLHHLGRVDEARAAWLDLLRLHPEQMQGRLYLANTWLSQPERGLEVLAPVAHLAASHADLSFVLACLHERLFDAEEALRHYATALELSPLHADAWSNWLLTRHCVHPVDLPAVREVAVRHGRALQQAASQQPLARPARAVGQRLRVGLLSSDLREHVVGHFLASVLPALQARGVELVAYANHEPGQRPLLAIQQACVRWHEIKALPDHAVTSLIAADDLDVLLDLNGHTQGRRLGVLLRHAAPRQVAWLGYFGTTGLDCIDAVIADPHAVPPQEAQHFVEPLLYMPHSRLCLAEPAHAPPVAPEPPMAALPFITFGCFQNINKINDAVLAVWQRVLQAVPASVLRVQSLKLERPEHVLRLRERLRRAGIDLRRVWLAQGLPRQHYLAQYAEVDVLLDTFPYPGGTTTAEALWMGVPTLTLATPGMLGRQGQAMLAQVGLSDWVAHSEEEYVALATALGTHPAATTQRLRDLRSSLRETARRSALFDATRFAADFEQLLRGFCARTAC